MIFSLGQQMCVSTVYYICWLANFGSDKLLGNCEWAIVAIVGVAKLNKLLKEWQSERGWELNRLFVD